MSLMKWLFGAGRPACVTCGESWYAHHDHRHVAPCPFGDCGDYWDGGPRDA